MADLCCSVTEALRVDPGVVQRFKFMNFFLVFRQSNSKRSYRLLDSYKLHNIFDQLILTTPSAGTSRKYKGAVLSGLGCQSDEAARVAVKRH